MTIPPMQDDRCTVKDSAYTYEYAYECSECGFHEWRRELPRLGGNWCPECGTPMTNAAKREFEE